MTSPTDWRDERTRVNGDGITTGDGSTHESADPMRRTPGADGLGRTRPTACGSLVYDYDWLGEHDDAGTTTSSVFYERSIGVIANGVDDVEAGFVGRAVAPELRPGALYLSTNIGDPGVGRRQQRRHQRPTTAAGCGSNTVRTGTSSA